MPEPEYVDRPQLVAQGAHHYEQPRMVSALASIHDALRAALGRTCRVHASFNKEELHRLCTLGEMDRAFIKSLFDQYPAGAKQPLLSAVMHYETRTRSAQAAFYFDHTIDAIQICIIMPERGLPRNHVIALARSIIEPLAPSWVTYNNRALVDALYALYPNFFRTAWLTYHEGFPRELPRFRTLEEVETARGIMTVAKNPWFGRTDRKLLNDLVDLDALIEAYSPFEA